MCDCGRKFPDRPVAALWRGWQALCKIVQKNQGGSAGQTCDAGIREDQNVS